MRYAFILAFVASLTVAGAAGAAGPYDGNWSGEVSGISTTSARGGASFCNASVTATITNNQLRGTIQYGREARPFGGNIAPDGSFSGRSGSLAMTGKFSGSSFEGTYNGTGSCTTYRMTLKHS